MKKIIWILLLVFLFVACDDNTEELDGLINDKENLEIKLNEEVLQSEILEDTLASTEEEVQVLNEEVQTLNDEVLSLKEQLQVAQEEMINPVSLPASLQVIAASLEVVTLLESEDYLALSEWVHPSMGVRFSPYFFVDTSSDVVMTANDIENIASDTSLYNWGNFDGSGDPIDLTFADYYDRFIYDQDYENPEIIGNNTAVQVGNMLDNHDNVYPTASFVEFHFSGFDPQYAGMDWRSLRLVFVEDGGEWYLIGIVHGEWTI